MGVAGGELLGMPEEERRGEGRGGEGGPQRRSMSPRTHIDFPSHLNFLWLPLVFPPPPLSFISSGHFCLFSSSISLSLSLLY